MKLAAAFRRRTLRNASGKNPVPFFPLDFRFFGPPPPVWGRLHFDNGTTHLKGHPRDRRPLVAKRRRCPLILM